MTSPVHILQKHSDHSAKAKIGGGYLRIGRYSKTYLITLINQEPGNEILLAHAPHQDGG